jgi:hypothetical protein
VAAATVVQQGQEQQGLVVVDWHPRLAAPRTTQKRVTSCCSPFFPLSVSEKRVGGLEVVVELLVEVVVDGWVMATTLWIVVASLTRMAVEAANHS